MADEIDLEKCNFWNFRSPRDLYLGSGHMAYCNGSLIDLYLHTKFYWNRKNSVDGRTYRCTYHWAYVRTY